MSLLEEAKKIKIKPRNREINIDQIELAIAWLKDEITISQVSKVLGGRHGNAAYHYLAIGLRQAFKDKKIMEAINRHLPEGYKKALIKYEEERKK